MIGRSYRQWWLCRGLDTWVCRSRWDRHAAALMTDASAANACLYTCCNTLCHTYDSDAATHTQQSRQPFDSFTQLLQWLGHPFWTVFDAMGVISIIVSCSRKSPICDRHIQVKFATESFWRMADWIFTGLIMSQTYILEMCHRGPICKLFESATLCSVVDEDTPHWIRELHVCNKCQ